MENTGSTEQLDYSTFTKEALHKEMMLAFGEITHHNKIIADAQEAIADLNEVIATVAKFLDQN